VGGSTVKTTTAARQARCAEKRKERGEIRLSGWLSTEASSALPVLEARGDLAGLTRQDIVSKAIVAMANNNPESDNP
jgi:CBS-domain-containing membrane protein